MNLVVVTLSPGFIVNRPEMRRGCLAEVSCALATTLDLSHYRRASAVQSARSGSSRGCQASPQIEICIELGTIVERFRRLRERLRHHALARTSRTRVDVLWPAKGQPQVPTNVDRWWRDGGRLYRIFTERIHRAAVLAGVSVVRSVGGALVSTGSVLLFLVSTCGFFIAPSCFSHIPVLLVS